MRRLANALTTEPWPQLSADQDLGQKHQTVTPPTDVTEKLGRKQLTLRSLLRPEVRARKPRSQVARSGRSIATSAR